MQKPLPSKIAVYLHNVQSNELEKFNEMLDYFEKNNFVFCDPLEFVSNDEKNVFLSFDDNYSEWLGISEILYKRNIRSTFYINTGPMRDRADSEHIKDYFRRIKYSENATTLSSDEIYLISSKYNQIIGSHSVNHLNLTNIDFYLAKEEIKSNKCDLEEITKLPINHFSYPFGMSRFFNEELRKYCFELGFKTISNAIPGLLHATVEPSNISRTMWDFKKSLEFNIRNLRIDGRLFEKLTGKSSISYF